MKKICFFIIWAISTFLFTSCKENRFIEFDKSYIEVDYQAQDITLHTTDNIFMASYYVAESDTEFVDHYTEKGVSYSVGEWFVVIQDHSKPRQVIVSVEENQTDKDRKVVIWVNDVDDNIDYATIVQKAKPAE